MLSGERMSVMPKLQRGQRRLRLKPSAFMSSSSSIVAGRPKLRVRVGDHAAGALGWSGRSCRTASPCGRMSLKMQRPTVVRMTLLLNRGLLRRRRPAVSVLGFRRLRCSSSCFHATSRDRLRRRSCRPARLRAIVQADEDARVHRDLAQLVRHDRFLRAVEDLELALVAFAIGW